MARKSCEAQRWNDQWICDRCGVQWDIDDQDPPECRPTLKPLLAVLLIIGCFLVAGTMDYQDAQGDWNSPVAEYRR